MQSKTSFPDTCLSFIRLRLFACAVGLSCTVAINLHATTITVTTTGDNGSGSLRDALAIAADGDTIDASSATGTILLTSGELLVTNSVDIIGPGPSLLIVDGNAANRVFHIFGGPTATISSLTVTNGAVSNGFGGGFGGDFLNEASTLTISNIVLSGGWVDNSGGGIYNNGATLIVNNSTLCGNVAANFGGAILNDGATLTINNSTLRNNVAGFGGGIMNWNGASAEIINCTLMDNSSGSGGGGIYNADSSVKITNCTLNGNYGLNSSSGGGVYNYGCCLGSAELIIVNSTISSNSAGSFGGGLCNTNYFGTATMQVFNSTVAANSAGSGGDDVYNYNNFQSFVWHATVQIGSTILQAGDSNGNISANAYMTSLGYNLSSDDGGGFLTGPGDQINTDPMLGPLQDNGGPTFTHALLPGSPAINGGDPNFTPPSDFDQRGPGFPRIVCGRVDIGAFEAQGTPPIITCPSNIVANAVSPKGAFVSFTPTASDDCSTASVSSTPPSGSRFAIGDTLVSCIATDSMGNQATCNFTVHVKGAAEQIADLITLVRQLNLNPWTANVLTANLQAASNALRRGNTRAACGDLDVFRFEVELQTWFRQIAPISRSRILIRRAQRVQDVLGCHDGFDRSRP